MKKTVFYILCVLTVSTASSCAFLAALIDMGQFVDTISSNNKDDDVRGNVQVYINNKTDELLAVFAKVRKTIHKENENEYMEIDLARIPKGKEQKINVKKGTEIFIKGGHTQRVYREFVCDIDQETVVIY
jgi:hypothetical protein